MTASHIQQLHLEGSQTDQCQCSCVSCVVLGLETSLLFGTMSVSKRPPPSEVPDKLPHKMCVGECVRVCWNVLERCRRAAATMLGHSCAVRRVSVWISGKASVPLYVPVGRCHT